MRPTKGDVHGWIRASVRAGEVVIDVGANVGLVSETFAAQVGPTGTVYAIEPDVAVWDKLTRRSTMWPQIQSRSCAASDVSGVIPFFRARDAKQSSCARASLNGSLVCETKIPALRLDDVTDAPVSCVKIDAQGWETRILEGASRLLRQCPTWIVECWPYGLTRAGSSAGRLLTQLADAGLTVQGDDDWDAIAQSVEAVKRVHWNLLAVRR